MTVPNEVPLVDYVGNGTTKEFNVPFQYETPNTLFISVNGVAPPTSDYSFNPNTGNFVFYTAPADGVKIRIVRDTPEERDTDYDDNYNTFRPRTLNKDFDRLWRAIQEHLITINLNKDGLAQEILDRIQADEDMLDYIMNQDNAIKQDYIQRDSVINTASIERDNRIEQESKDRDASLKGYIDQMIALVTGDPSFNGITTDFVTEDGETQRQKNDKVKRGIGNTYDSSLSYNVNERVLLDDGTEVISTIASNTNDPNVNMTGWVNKEKEQDLINSLTASEGVNILSVYGGVNDFGAAIELAFTKARSLGISTIKIPAKTYTAVTSANLTLDSDFSFVFDSDVTINVVNEINVLDVTQTVFSLNIVAKNTCVYPLWDENISGESSFLKTDSQTLARSLTMSGVSTFFKPNSTSIMFENAVNGSGLNYSLIADCILQAKNPIKNQSNADGNGHSMGSVLRNCYLHSPLTGTGLTLVNQGDLACEGWSVEGGEIICGTVVKVIDQLNNKYLPPLLRFNGTHLNCARVCYIEDMCRVVFDACDIQLKVAKNDFVGVFELSGVQSFDLTNGTVISQVFEDGATSSDIIPLIYVHNNANGILTSQVKCFANLWMDIGDTPLIDFAESATLYGQIILDIPTQGSFIGKITSDQNTSKIMLVDSSQISSSNVSMNTVVGATGHSFDPVTGVLTLGNVLRGSFFTVSETVVNSGSTVKQIIVPERLGDACTVSFDGINITLEHNANFLQPTQSNGNLLYGGSVEFVKINDGISKVINYSASSAFTPYTTPTSTASQGHHGAKYFSAGFVYEYIYGTGWVRYAASTF